MSLGKPLQDHGDALARGAMGFSWAGLAGLYADGGFIIYCR